MNPRNATSADIGAIGSIAEATGLFPAEYLPEMIAPALAGGEEVWLVAEDDGAAQGFAFARPEEMADRVWNVLALGVSPDAQRGGHASGLLHALEARLEARMIIIETTQTPEQEAARAFYAKEGYEAVAQITDFYAEGEDKIVYRKVMG
jgi:ribosomal protein S18 acetylase RimI-like enzyme